MDIDNTALPSVADDKPLTARCARCSAVKPISAFTWRGFTPRRLRKVLCAECKLSRERAETERYRTVKAERRAAKRKADPEAAHKSDAIWRESQRDQHWAAARKWESDPTNMARKLAATDAWRKRNAEHVKERHNITQKEWKLNNPEKAKTISDKGNCSQKIKRRGSTSEIFSLGDIINRDGKNCYLCGRVTLVRAKRDNPLKSEIEHVIPLSEGGHHTLENVRCACRRCNRLKGSKLTPEQTVFLLRAIGAIE